MNINRLGWACRRGMLELDLILQPFLDNVFTQLDPSEQALFEYLLRCEDQDLYAWLLDRVEPEDTQIKTIVAIVKAHTGVRASV